LTTFMRGCQYAACQLRMQNGEFRNEKSQSENARRSPSLPLAHRPASSQTCQAALPALNKISRSRSRIRRAATFRLHRAEPIIEFMTRSFHTLIRRHHEPQPGKAELRPQADGPASASSIVKEPLPPPYERTERFAAPKGRTRQVIRSAKTVKCLKSAFFRGPRPR